MIIYIKKELVDLCLMAHIDITKKEVCLIASNSIDIDYVNELGPKVTFDELKNIFEELYYDFKKTS